LHGRFPDLREVRIREIALSRCEITSIIWWMKMTDEISPQGKREDAPVKEKRGPSGLRILVYVLGILLLILIAGYLTIGVVITEAPPAASYPYNTTYQVFLPASEKVTIGNADIIAIPVGERVTLSINKENKDMGIGETKTIQERRATISALFLKIMEFDFRVDATYRGRSGDTTEFYLAFRTSQQVPSFLIERLLPASVRARPV
jgi:hypothetical protein